GQRRGWLPAQCLFSLSASPPHHWPKKPMPPGPELASFALLTGNIGFFWTEAGALGPLGRTPRPVSDQPRIRPAATVRRSKRGTLSVQPLALSCARCVGCSGSRRHRRTGSPRCAAAADALRTVLVALRSCSVRNPCEPLVRTTPYYFLNIVGNDKREGIDGPCSFNHHGTQRS